MLNQQYKEIDVIVYTHLKGGESFDSKGLSSTKRISFPSGNMNLSGNFLIISEYSDENLETSHVFNLNEIKSYRAKF